MKCELCGKTVEFLETCQECGTQYCDACGDFYRALCQDCIDFSESSDGMEFDDMDMDMDYE